MLAKIALRNVKRQISNYLIYFITVALTVSMMFALCNLVFSKELLEYANQMEKLRIVLIEIAVLVTLVVAFVLGYAASYMLKLRKREFGTYLTLGMTRQNILAMFTVENFLIGAGALGCGIFFGLFLFQGMIGLVSHVLDLKVSLGAYSMEGLILTVALAAVMFLMSTVSSAIYLKKVSIYDLLHDDKKVDKAIQHPFIWLLVTIVSLAGLVFGLFNLDTGVDMIFAPNMPEGAAMVRLSWSIALIAIAIVFYHIGFAKSAIYLLLRNSRIRSRGTNTFVFRQLSGQLNTNSVLCGIIALLISATIFCTNACIGEKSNINEYLNHNYPFDISASKTMIDDVSAMQYAPFDYDKSIGVIEKYADIKEEFSYDIYTSGNSYLHGFTPWTGGKYEHLCDSFIRESDFNKLMDKLGYKKVDLDHNFIILTSTANLTKCNFSGSSITKGNEEYSFLKITDYYPDLAKCYFLAVVPDKLAEDMTVMTHTTDFELKNDNYDAQGLYNELWEDSERGYFPFEIRGYQKLTQNSFKAIMIVGEMYMAVIFVFMAVAILTMKLLSGISEDRRRYELLYKMGSSRSERKKALLKQTFSFFAFPFFLPIILSIPIAYINGKTVVLSGYTALLAESYWRAAVIALTLIGIQLIYFIATYSIQKHNLID